MSDTLDLTGKLLIAMPGMGDPRFVKSLVFVCAHSDDGAMGLVINKPTGDIMLDHLLEQLEIEMTPDVSNPPVYFGGPVETGRGFVLHGADFTSALNTLQIDGGFGLTATLDVLEEMGRGTGPTQALVALGYAGWGPGQLESELAENGWLTCDASRRIVFETADAAKWEAALNSIGVGALTLSADSGRA
ncbi:YqgE/AlgH family protein [Lutimaribacter sp. EGI FJ00015]|uniref:YqgE/AlgH family protein n=2 Tax=Lutimaribacter degradans TaxID=2945989 RepID=A0ACC5ZTV8_9RHOB|nr:YqgE/AlgH family protein [Lutimaribacter sp. EGI FJ00013]MCM2561610.1 YqgE/AlgH family protein [Lutimaribacter sp. EGI FJ00013]MCO0612679.1 YqgE/AlgH family protein [Lutimaribacter sp. EGI FJ00015]MCO0635337.1 YqgE/AlgH family protein [Lutimaribacter sp. EGI FJ00014]